MKTFSKIMSVVLIAVMCFSLCATSAYAFSLDGSGDSGFGLDDSSSYGGGFTVGDDSGFSLGGYSEPAQSFTEPVTQTAPQVQDDSFGLAETAQVQEPATVAVAEENAPLFTLEESEVLLLPYDPSMTFTPDKTSIKVTDTDAAATVTITGTGGYDTDTFKRITYSTSPSGDNRQNIPATGFAIQAGSITIQGSWLKTLTAGQTYYFYGERTDELPIKLGFVAVNAGTAGDYGTFNVNPVSYTKYASPEPALIKVTATTAGKTFEQFVKYAVIRQGTTSGGTYCTDYEITNSYTLLTLGKNFLLSLQDGTYDIYGITNGGVNVKLGAMTIKSAGGGGSLDGSVWTLSPDYSGFAWTSGDDILWFWSDLMAKRSAYPARIVVVRYGVGANSIPNKTVDVNQYWDVQTQPGTFGLGTNFLSSLSAGTYTLQVVDLKTLDCTNIVTFRIGSTLRAIDTDKHVIGSIKNLRFLCDEPVSEVYVGNIPLTYGEDYALSNGNKTITLSFEFLNKRSAGNTYTIKALTYSGTYPSTTFQILSAAQGSASPRTGDESNLGLWAAFLLLSGTAIVVLVPKLRKHDI